jgi:hypothetical protein
MLYHNKMLKFAVNFSKPDNVISEINADLLMKHNKIFNKEIKTLLFKIE